MELLRYLRQLRILLHGLFVQVRAELVDQLDLLVYLGKLRAQLLGGVLVKVADIFNNALALLLDLLHISCLLRYLRCLLLVFLQFLAGILANLLELRQ